MNERLMSRHRVAASIRLPYPPYLRKVIRRSVGIWLLVRSAYVMVLMAGAAFFDLLSPPEVTALVLHPGWGARAVLVAVAAVLEWWERLRFHELLLHANLGAWPGWFWVASLLTALVMDLAVQTLLAAF